MAGAENQLVETKKSGGNRHGLVAWIVAAVVFAISLPLYYTTAKKRAELFDTNSIKSSFFDSTDTKKVKVHVIFHHDQHVYMNLGRLLKKHDYDYFVPRQRTPGYPLLLSLLYDDENEYEYEDGDPRRISDEQFATYREFNIILSMVLLVAIFLFSTSFIDIYASLILTWICGWTLFLFKCIYVQPELLFYTLFLFSFVLLWQQINKPTWKRGIAAGFMVAAAYFVKSSIPPLLLLFTVCFALRRFSDLRKMRKTPGFTWSAWFQDVGKGAVIPLLWLTLLSPYFVQTAKVYGNPFWSVHTAHLMWQEDETQKKKWRILSDPETEIPEDAPSFSKYWANHKDDLIHFVERPLEGADHTLSRIGVEYREGYRLLKKRILRVCVVIGLLAFIPILRFMGRNWAESLYIIGFFIGYGELYGWMEIIRAGPRLMLSLFPCAVFITIAFICKFARPVTFPKLGIRIPTKTIAYSIVAYCLLVAIYNIIGKGEESAAWLIAGGS